MLRTAPRIPTPALLYVHDNLTPLVRERFGVASRAYDTAQRFLAEIAREPHVKIGTLEKEIASLTDAVTPEPFDVAFGFGRKGEEIAAGRQILDDIARGRFRSVPENLGKSLNIISCPSCSRVENEAFVELAEKVREVTAYARDYAITIAVMGCRVNGPGETDDADLGLWCAPTHVNLKRKSETIGTFGYDEVLSRLKSELDSLIGSRGDLLREKQALRRS